VTGLPNNDMQRTGDEGSSRQWGVTLASPAEPKWVSAEEASRPTSLAPTRPPRRRFCMPSSGRLKA
jgi:uncharacterized membrane-anchored protein